MQQNEFPHLGRYLIVSLLTVVALVLTASAYSERVLRVSMMPDESASVQRRKLKPLTDYLVNKIGMKMEFRPVANDDTLVERFVFHELDLVWIDGANFTRAGLRSKERVIPLVRREAELKTRSATFSSPDQDDYTWTVRADMDADLRKRLTDAFLALSRNNAQDREILNLLRASRFIPADAGSLPAMEAGRSLELPGKY